MPRTQRDKDKLNSNTSNNDGQMKHLLEALVGLGQASFQGAKETAQSASKFNPIATLGQLLGEASIQPDVKNLQQAVTGTQSNFSEDVQQDPLLMARQKEVEKLGKEQVQEGYKQGVPLEHMQDQIRQESADKMNQEGIGTLKKVLAGAFQGFGAEAAPTLFQGNLERDKMGLEMMKTMLESQAGPDALNPESATKFNLLVSGQKSLQQAAGILEQNPSVLGLGNLPGFMKSQAGRQFNTELGNAFESRLRAVSGATISEEEVQRQKKEFMPKLTDSEETIRTKINTLNEFFGGAIGAADPTGTHRQRGGINSNVDFNKSFTQTPGGNNFRIVQ